MNTETRSQDASPEGAGNNQHPGPLVWHPEIRALFWLTDWTFLAVCAAIVWQFLATGGFPAFEDPRSTGALAAWLAIALALLGVVLLGIKLWWSLLLDARREYGESVAIRLILVESLVVLLLLGLYIWFASWVLDHVWTLLPGSSRSLTPVKSMPRVAPTWLAAVFLTSLSGLLLWVLVYMLRASVWKYWYSFRMLGLARLAKGVLVMTLLRFREPRKAFFLQAPFVSLMPWLALCAALYAKMPIAVFCWVIPALLLGCAVTQGIKALTPPTWLFLGASNFESLRVFHNLRRRWGRRFGVTLLDLEGSEGNAYYFAEANEMVRRGSFGHRFFTNPATPRVWSLRTRPAFWEHTVLLLIDLVPVVVVDARTVSDHVRQESEWLSAPERIGKAWFLGAADGRAAALVDLLSVPNSFRATVLASLTDRVVTEQILYATSWDRSGLHRVTDTPWT
jgi:hypothetical protein